MHTKRWSRRRVLTAGAGALVLAPLAGRVRAGGGLDTPVLPPAGNVPVANTVPLAGRFDLTGAARPLLWNATVQPGTMIQSFGFDDARGHIYFAQALAEKGAPAAGRLRLTRTDLSGRVLGSMVLREAGGRGWGHGTTIAVEAGPAEVRLWVEVDGPVLRRGESTGRALARIPFTDGATLTPASGVVERHRLVPGAAHVTCAIDPVEGRLIQRFLAGRRWRYAVYSLADVVAHRYHPLAWFPEPPLDAPGRPFAESQGFTVHGRYLYVLASGAGGGTHITTIDLRSGGIVQQRDAATGHPRIFQKPEGMAVQRAGGSARLCYGYAGGALGARTTTLMYLGDLI
ncbi:teichoic acid biosynthesis protein C [Spirillospora sp. NPDC047279]|uniref:phage baseplate protein n=1 Tax=Spirillospora sp. NPDC047279 TaxID=3155478 RepID=UPI0033FB1B5B